MLVSGTLEHQSADVKDKRYEKLTPLSVGIHNNSEGGREGDRGKKISFKLKPTSLCETAKKRQHNIYKEREKKVEKLSKMSAKN